MRMSCRADGTSPSFFWAIDLANVESSVQFQFATGGMILNANGVYQLPETMTSANITTLGLLINNTAINNGTTIHCSRGTLSSMSTLLVFSKSTVIIPVMVIIIEMHALQLKNPLSSSLRCSNNKRNQLTSHGVKNQPLRLMHHNYSHLKSTMTQTVEWFC